MPERIQNLKIRLEKLKLDLNSVVEDPIQNSKSIE